MNNFLLVSRHGCVSPLSHQEYTLISLKDPQIKYELKSTVSVSPPTTQSISPDTNFPASQTKASQLLPLTCQSFLGPWCLGDHRPVRPPAAPQRNILPPVTTHPSLPLPHPHPSWARQTKIKSQWSESGRGSCFADQSVDTWLSLTGWALNPIVSPTGLLSVVPLSLWLRAGERPD